MHIDLDYEIKCTPRYTKNPHNRIFKILEQGRDRYAKWLNSFSQLASDFRKVPATPRESEPYWLNDFFSPFDAITSTGMIASHRPSLYVEVGSGNSTRFARRAVQLYSPNTSIISIDPNPRSDIDAICDQVIRQPLEDIEDFFVFDQLRAGDFLFVDNSHRCFMNSDVTVIFLDVLPRLAAGVVVHFHDIFLPWDYPIEWIGRFYSEQYLLACWLLAGNRLQVELPAMFVSRDKALSHLLDPFWPHVASPQRDGGSFWVTIHE